MWEIPEVGARLGYPQLRGKGNHQTGTV